MHLILRVMKDEAPGTSLRKNSQSLLASNWSFIYSGLGYILLRIPTTNHTLQETILRHQQTDTKGPSYLFVWFGVRRKLIGVILACELV